MSTRSTIALIKLGTEKELHIFYDVDGVHITIEKDTYDYEVDIHITEKQWKEVVSDIVDLERIGNEKLEFSNDSFKANAKIQEKWHKKNCPMIPYCRLIQHSPESNPPIPECNCKGGR